MIKKTVTRTSNTVQPNFSTTEYANTVTIPTTLVTTVVETTVTTIALFGWVFYTKHESMSTYY